MNQTEVKPGTTSRVRAISLRWSLLQAFNSLLDSYDDLKAIKKDKNYCFTYEDRKDIKNLLAKIELLLPELKEKI